MTIVSQYAKFPDPFGFGTAATPSGYAPPKSISKKAALVPLPSSLPITTTALLSSKSAPLHADKANAPITTQSTTTAILNHFFISRSSLSKLTSIIQNKKTSHSKTM
jgi:hypothetical protein